jgi:diaminopimelate decarboxylase
MAAGLLPKKAACAQGMMGMLGALGAGFDCASPGEIDAVLALGVPPERIIYAHPVKSPSQVLPWTLPCINHPAMFTHQGGLGDTA